MATREDSERLRKKFIILIDPRNRKDGLPHSIMCGKPQGGLEAERRRKGKTEARAFIKVSAGLLSHKKERNWVICRDVDGT